LAKRLYKHSSLLHVDEKFCAVGHFVKNGTKTFFGFDENNGDDILRIKKYSILFLRKGGRRKKDTERRRNREWEKKKENKWREEKGGEKEREERWGEKEREERWGKKIRG
jgi:hypothetical protein